MGGRNSKLLLPCTVGHHSPSPGGYMKMPQDASIGVVVFAFFLFACGMTLSVGRWLTINQTMPVYAHIVKLFLSLLMITGCLDIVAFWKCLHKFIISRPRRQAGNSSTWTTRDFFLNRMSFIGLVVFFLCGIVLDAFPLYAELQCLGQFTICGIIIPHLLDVLFYTCRFVFKFLVVMFSYMYEDKHLARCPLIRYCLLAITLPVICNWTDGLVNEATAHTSISQFEITSCKSKLTIGVSDSDYSIDNGTSRDHCIEGKTTAHLIALHAHTILYPFEVEFSLMALKILLHIYCSLKWPSFSNQAGETVQNDVNNLCINEQESDMHIGDRTEGSQAKSGYGVSSPNAGEHPKESNDMVQEDVITEDVHGQGSDRHISDRPEVAQVNSVKSPDEHTEENNDLAQEDVITDGEHTEEQSLLESQRTPACFPVIMFFIVVINVAMVVVVAVTFFGGHSVYKYCLLVYWIPLIMASLQGLRVINDQFESDFSVYTGLEVLVVVSMLGAFCQLFFQFYATIGCLLGTKVITNSTLVKPCNNDYDAHLLWVSAVGIAVNFVQMFLQVTFMAYASKLKVRYRSGSNAWWLRQCALYIAIANLILWLINSFDQAMNKQFHPAQKYFYGNAWIFISYVTVPFFLFFRFNSFLIFLKIFLKVR